MLMTENTPEIQRLFESLEKVEDRICELASQKTSDDWMTPKDVTETFNMSKDLLYELRKSGKIEFSQIGKKFYYKREVLLELIERHVQEDFGNC